MKALLFIAFILPCCVAIGQANIFQDAKGESALKFFGNSVSLSTKDESINFAVGNYYRTTHSNAADRFRRWSATLELKADEGISNLKNGKEYLIDGSTGFYHGWKKVSPATGTNTAWEMERFVSGAIGIDRTKLFNTALPLEDMIYSEGKLIYKFEIGQFGYRNHFLYGLGASFKRQTNVDDLKTKSINFLDYSSVNDSTLVFREKQAYDVKEFSGSQHVLSVNADGAFLLNTSSASGSGDAPPAFLAFHFRYQLPESQKSQFNPGIGLYLGKHGAPRTIIGGFNIQFLDLFNAQNKKTNAWDRAVINFVVGFHLSN